MVSPLMILSLDQGNIYEATRPRDQFDELVIAEVNAQRSTDPIADMGSLVATAVPSRHATGLVHFLDRLVAYLSWPGRARA